MQCPKCSGPVYDNREKNVQRVAEGKKPMPEFKCRDESCGWVQWPPKEPKTAKPQGSAPPRGAKWTWQSLSSCYVKSLALAVKHCTAKVPGATPEAIIAAAATIFIAASRDGVQEEVERENGE